MENALSGGSVTLYLFFLLLPGFLGSFVYDYFLEGESRANTDKITTALILTLLSSIIMHYAANTPIIPNIEITTETRIDSVINAFLAKNLLYTSILSTIIGFVFAMINNHGLIYAIMRRLGLSMKAPANDVWQRMLYADQGYWIAVSFRDGRRLTGWPEMFSSMGRPREIFLADATWYDLNEAGEVITSDIEGPGVYLSDFDNVVAIEILQ
jgi:hypothetical protein